MSDADCLSEIAPILDAVVKEGKVWKSELPSIKASLATRYFFGYTTKYAAVDFESSYLGAVRVVTGGQVGLVCFECKGLFQGVGKLKEVAK